MTGLISPWPLRLLTFIFALLFTSAHLKAQRNKLTPENIQRAFEEASRKTQQDPTRPSFHLVPPAGGMGDPNGGIYYKGWYHIFYGLQPFGGQPGSWYWAHARSKDMLHWEHMKPNLTPAFELGLNDVGSGSTIITDKGVPLAFHSTGTDGAMKFWQVEFTADDLNQWEHKLTKPVLTLEQPGLPPFDTFWRDPFVFSAGGRTFLIACADLFEEDYVPVPIFEAKNPALSEWEYQGILFSYPKHKMRNMEVPEFRKIGDKWVLIASCDAPVDRVYYFTGDFDLTSLKFNMESEGIIDYSGHYYAQETIQDDRGNLYLMAWIPGWDRQWLPGYMNHPLKSRDPVWNGAFAIPRKLRLDSNGKLIQTPVDGLNSLRQDKVTVPPRKLPVTSAFTAIDVLDEVRGNTLEIQLTLDLNAASFCGINVLSDSSGKGGLPIVWSGDVLSVDGINVPLKEWRKREPLHLQIFVDKQFVEVFVNGGRYCITRQVNKDNIKGDHVGLTRLGGTARLVQLEAWKMGSIQQ